jgi:hypothetical protein
MSRQKLMTLSALAVLCVLASVTMHAKAAQQEGRQARERQDGMVVVRDPQTGKMRAPTPEELKALRAKSPPPSVGLGSAPQEPRQLSSRRDGARGVRLGEKTIVYDVVTRGEDGKLQRQCVQGDAAAADALQHPANTEHKEHRHETR